MIKLNLDELSALALDGLNIRDEFMGNLNTLLGDLDTATDNIESTSLKQTIIRLQEDLTTTIMSTIDNLDMVNEFLKTQVQNYYEINANVNEKIDGLVSKISTSLTGVKVPSPATKQGPLTHGAIVGPDSDEYAAAVGYNTEKVVENGNVANVWSNYIEKNPVTYQFKYY